MTGPVVTASATKWMLPAAKELYDHRNDLAAIWNRIGTTLLGKKHNVVVTGIAGSGKSVLLDHLDGTAPKVGYVSPGRSETMEKGKMRASNKRIYYSIVPGQASSVRMSGLAERFESKAGVDGIIHVMCNGYVGFRESDTPALITAIAGNDIDDYLKIQREEELSSLVEILGYAERSYHTHKKPSWVLVAVSKYDLYYDRANEASEYYSPGKDSPFVKQMEYCKEQIGRNNFRWDAIPVASLLDAFNWPPSPVLPKLTEPQRDHFLTGFAKTLENYCGN